MTDALKVLGQSIPPASTLSAIYTVPPATQTSSSSIVCCNQSSSQTAKFRVSVAVGGAIDDSKQYIYFDLPIDPNDTFIATIGMSLAAGDVVRVESDMGNVSFNLFGVEVT